MLAPSSTAQHGEVLRAWLVKGGKLGGGENRFVWLVRRLGVAKNRVFDGGTPGGGEIRLVDW